MVCKNCGTALIRGHAFCMNCGTPVPAGTDENEEDQAPAADLFSGGDDSNDDIGGSQEGTLVFCPACGMHMQKNPDRCEKCGMILRENIHSDNPQSVPAFNPDVGLGELSGGAIGEFGFGGGIGDIGGNMSGLGGGMSSIGGDMAGIGGGMAGVGGGMAGVGGGMAGVGGGMASVGGGMESVGGGMESIGRGTETPAANSSSDSSANMFNTSNDDNLNALASFSINPTNIMSAIDAPAQPDIVRQKEPEKGQERRMEDFSMSDGGIDSSMMSDNTVPIIEGGSMDEDSSKDIELDPYKFLNTSLGDMLAEEPAEPQKPAEPSAEAVPEPITPIIAPVAEIVPEPIAPISEPIAEIVPEPIAPIQEPVAEIAPEPIAPIPEPIAEIVPEPIAPIPEPIAEIVPEPIAPIPEPVAEIVPEPIAPIEEPVAEIVPEPIAPTPEPVAEIAPEPIAPIEEPVAEIVPEPIAPTPEPVAEIAPEPIAPTPEPVAEIAPEPIAPIEEPIAEIVPEPIAPIEEPVAEIVPEPIAPIEEPVAEIVPEPIAPIEEPVAETASDPIAPIEEPVAETASDPIAPTPEPVEEIVPEPAASIAEPVAEPAPEPIAPIAEPVAAVAAAAVSAPVDDFVPEEIGFITESTPFNTETAQSSEKTSETAPSKTATAVLPEPLTASMPVKKSAPNDTIPLNRPDPSKANNAPDPSKGKLVYCRNCGQDMYETEAVCKNCGAPYKGAYVPPKNAPSRGGSAKSDEPKKIFGIFTPSVFAGIIAVALVVIALGIFIGVRSNTVKTPNVGGNTASVNTSSSGSSDPVSSGDTSTDVPPVQSTDDSSSSSSDPISSSDTSSSSDDPNSDPPESSSSSSTTTSSSTQQSSSTKTQSSSTKTQSSSSTKTQSSTNSQSSSSSSNQMSAKVKSLESDRVNIMKAVESLAGEVGKIEAVIRHANYALENSTSVPVTTLKNFFSGTLGKAFLDSINSNRISVLMIVDTASPTNSELKSLYDSLLTLRSRYNDCYNFITNYGSAAQFTSNAASYISKFNTQLSSMGFSKLVTSAYTSANKDQAYASMLRSAQTCMNDSANAFTTIQTAIIMLGETRFYRAIDTLESNVASYIAAAGAMGKLNAYRLMLLGASSSYSSSYSNISAAYNSLSTVIDRHVNVEELTLNKYTADTNTAIAAARSSATKIGSAIARAF